MKATSMVLLVTAVFTVALGYSAILPTLPLMLEQLLGGPSNEVISRHTGLISGIYMFAIFLFAPLWGRLSDAIGRRCVILSGLAGYVLTLVAFGLAKTLWTLYTVRALAGAFVSAVVPVASAYVSENADEEQRARRLAAMGAASLIGFLLGPAVSGWAFGLARTLQTGIDSHTLSMIPLYVTAALGIPVWLGMYFRLPEVSGAGTGKGTNKAAEADADRRTLWVLLISTLLVMYALGSFEVSIALQGRQSLGLDPYRIGVMFIECSLIMVLVQALIFCFPVLKRLSGRLVLLFGFLGMTAGFSLLPIVKDFGLLLFVIALIAAGSGFLLPFLTYRFSFNSPLGLGTTLGLQTAAASLGQGLGSAIGGWLFGLFREPSFWITGALMVVGALVAPLVRYGASRSVVTARSLGSSPK